MKEENKLKDFTWCKQCITSCTTMSQITVATRLAQLWQDMWNDYDMHKLLINEIDYMLDKVSQQ